MQGRILPKQSYKLDEAMEIYQQGKMMEFIPPRGIRIAGAREYPLEGTIGYNVLKTWREHFEGLGVPYILTSVQMSDRFWGVAMYKERRCEDAYGHRTR